MSELIKLLSARDKISSILLSNTGSFSGTGISQSEGMVNVYLRDSSEASKKKAYELIGSKKIDGTEIKFISSGNITALSCPTSYIEYNRPVCGGNSIGHACFDIETMLMTKNGLRRYNEIDYNTEFATLNTTTQELEWQKPTNIYMYDYKGNMMYFKGNAYDILVTPNHRMYCRINRRRKHFEFIHAEKLIDKKGYEFNKVANWNKQDTDYFYLPLPIEYEETIDTYKKVMELHNNQKYGWRKLSKLFPKYSTKISSWIQGSKPYTNTIIKTKVIFDIWAEFMGWYLSEGCCIKNRITIVQYKKTHPTYFEEIKSVITKMGYKYNIDNKETHIIFNSIQLGSYLKQFGLSSEKYIPDEIKNSSQRQINIFLDSLFKGDGCFIKGSYSKGYKNKWLDKYYSYSTVSSKLAYDVCEMLMKTGKGFRIHKYNPNKENHKEQYIITVSNKYTSPRVDIHPKIVEYDDKIWCVEVPNKTIYAIRNGKGIWTGNSVGAGTLGGLVYDATSKKVLGLSNNHVLAASSTYNNPQAVIGDTIFSPGLLDSSGIQYPFGKLYKYVPMNSTTNNFVDCAVVEPDSAIDLNPEIIGLGTPQGWEYSEEGTRIIKSGRTSGITEGTIIDKFATLEIDYGGIIIRMSDTIVTGKTADPGDSGSFALNKFNNKVVGLLFAGSSEITCYNRIENVMNALDILILPTDTMPAVQYTTTPIESPEYFVQSLALTAIGIGTIVGVIPTIEQQIQLAIHRRFQYK